MKLHSSGARRYIFSAFLAFFGLLWGCAPSSPTYLTVNVCLKDKQGVSEFLGLLQSIAVSEHMHFVDGSTQTQRDLKSIGAKMDKLQTPGSVLNIGIDRGDHNVMMGGNLGLPTYQVALGFSGEPPADRRFADMLVKQLGALWEVETVPAGQGAFPMKSCPGQI
jgi:hypothetical protein